MKKVLIVSSVASMIDQFNKDNIKVLQDLGYEVHVATNFDNPGTITIERATHLKEYLDSEKVTFFQIDFDRSPLNISKFRNAYKQLKKISEMNKYELVHLHSPIGGIIGRMVFKKEQTKIIYTAHGFHFFKGAPLKNWLIYYPIEKYFSKYTDVLITINKEDFKISKDKFDKTTTVFIDGVGVDNTEFLPLKVNQIKEIRLNNNFNTKDFLLIYVGELSNRKNQIELIEYMEKIVKMESCIKLLLVGKGPEKKILQRIVQEKKLENNVLFLGYRSDVSKLMGMSDVIVSSSKQEGLPVNLIEGLCMGKPLVVSNCRGNRDLVVNSHNGYVYTKESSINFEEKIIELYNSDKLRNEFGKNSLKLSKRYSSAKISTQMKKIYSK